MSKNYIYLIIHILLFIQYTNHAQNYKLVWSDEFNGRELDKEAWTYEIGGSGWGNEEWQYYTDRDTNLFFENGNLVIQALNESYLGKNYTSARIKTQDKKFFKYGKIEARIKLPYGQGIWPAFWMLGQSFSSIGWPACGEIDIMELIGGTNNDNRVHGTAHWQNNGQHAQYGGSYSLSSGIFADDFHIFSVVWDSKFIRWYVDGKQYHIIDITPSDLSEFQNEFFLILNLAVGGTWPGYPDQTTVFPQRLEVDYVRVYQEDSNFPEVNISTPNSKLTFDEGEIINLSANIAFNGSVDKVEFYQDSYIIGETDIEPYEMNWRNVAAGNYKVYAIAKTASGYSGVSDTLNITVGSGSEKYPYSGRINQIPGKIEAENFDIGKNNVAYFDKTEDNIGLEYRVNQGVDIEKCFDDNGGYNIGWAVQDEWFTFTVDIAKTSSYNFTARVSSEIENSSFAIEVNDSILVDDIQVPNTGDWQNWTSVESTLELPEGIHSLKIVVKSGEINFNYFEVYEPDASPQVQLLHPTGGEKFAANSIQEVLWDFIKVDKVDIGLSTDGGNSWTFIGDEINANFRSYRWKVPDVNSDNCVIMIIDSKSASINSITDSTFSIGDITSVQKNKELISQNIQLDQNYPNPFNPTTTISYNVPQLETGYSYNKQNNSQISGETGNVQVKLIVYNSVGKKVATLVNKKQNAGKYIIIFNAENLSSGIYYYQLSVGRFTETKKMILLR